MVWIGCGNQSGDRIGAVAELLNGIAHLHRIAGLVKRDQGLHSEIADVLQLLVVRAIHKGIPCAQSGRPATGFPHFGKLQVAAFKGGGLIHRVCGEQVIQTVKG
jgi:hypothetical protein